MVDVPPSANPSPRDLPVSRGSRVLRVLKIYLCLLPISAVIGFYLLVADRALVATEAQLAHARYGWPFKWIEQDLSRYQPREFPVAIEFNWTRAWGEPIVTSYDWVMMISGLLVIGAGVTGAYFVLVPLLRRGLGRSLPSSG